jgi:hypothetical protein
MNFATLKWLAVATIGLLMLVFVVERIDKGDTVAGGDYLVPGLKEHINDISKIIVTTADDTGPTTIERDGDQWLVKDKGGFPADVGKLRAILLDIADARKLEEKTANPERFAELGVDGPGADGTLLQISGANFEYSVIIGKVAQTKNRYARLADVEQSWLIDKNPDLPTSSGGWLAADLLDIDLSRIQSAAIVHHDGETISFDRQSAEDQNFTVNDIPKGRELSYPTVANGIAGVLKDLQLEDVRRSSVGELTATSVFTTFDGLEVTVRSIRDEADNGSQWIGISAAFTAPPASAKTEPPAPQDEVAIDDTTDDSSEDKSDAVSEHPDKTLAVKEEAERINARHAGWQYRIPDYKANLLTRHWKDILKEKE